jgi:putative membrane protein
MAWIRTALSMISFGFTIGKLESSLGSRKLDLGLGRTTDVRGVAYYLVLLGTLAMLIAGIQFWGERARLIRQGLPRRFSLALLIAALLSLLGLFVFTDMASRVAL